MSFEEILSETKFSTSETVKRLLPFYIQSGELQKMEARQKLEIEKVKAKYPNVSSDAEVMKAELYDYLLKLIPAIKEKYESVIPTDRMQKLEGLLDPKNIVVIDDAEDKHDFSANSEKGQVIVNLSKIAKKEDKETNIYEKIVTAKGSLPHEIFHIIVRMLKPEKLADERMIINLSSGEQITSRGMVGFMLNEGFVEKLSNEFCVEQEQLHPGEFYHSVAPQYIPYVNICNYMIQTSQSINKENIFSINYANCLETLTEEQQEQYKKAECISYAVRHGEDKIKRKILVDEVLSTSVEKVDLDLQLDNKSKEELIELRDSITSELSTPPDINQGIKR